MRQAKSAGTAHILIPIVATECVILFGPIPSKFRPRFPVVRQESGNPGGGFLGGMYIALSCKPVR